ncbi:hypothetical protein O181_033529 [Austropuccinia psidii MF-1]|uniref:Magnesium transporter n=1 Tax=Austropuccinia psidii MF-1 TaxID=1389203 RepID=A0A9Q3CYY2_9BASI|nr:hypothetical protein [Austropuccinia psidii MF-1]
MATTEPMGKIPADDLGRARSNDKDSGQEPMDNSKDRRPGLAAGHYSTIDRQRPGSSASVKARFRACVNAVTAAQRTVSGHSNHLIESSIDSTPSKSHSYRWNYSGSLEPGLNPNHPQPQLAHLSNLPVSVDLVDYSEDRVKFQSFQPYIASELTRLDKSIGRATTEKGQRPDWSCVRWINVNGLSWDVIKLLAIRYSLHPLAIEDCVHVSSRSKSEYYKQHLFVHAAIHTLAEQSDSSEPTPSNQYSSTERPSPQGQALESGIIDPDVDINELSDYKSTDLHSIAGSSGMMDLGVAAGSKNIVSQEVFDAEREVVRQLTKDYKVRIHVEKLSVFLLRDGTLITIFSHDGSRTVLPLIARLKTMDTLLRSSADASMLLQALLDIIVDQALDVVEAFRSKLTSLEAKVLVSPDLDTVRHLHVLSGELLLLKRTLTPLSTLVHGIMNHDPSERKVVNYRAVQRASSGDGLLEDGQSIATSVPGGGFISSQARLYLSDVLDHIDSVLSSLELFSEFASNLVDFTFNTMSFSTNESMKQLSIVTIIFLPLTFLTGYFGMNFVKFDAIQKSDAFFWSLAIPITTLMILMFMMERLSRKIKLRFKTTKIKQRK